MLERFFAKKVIPATVDVRRDVCLGDRRARHLRTLLEQGQWSRVHDVVAIATDQDIRDHWVSSCAEWLGRPGWLDEWRDAQPEHPLPWIVRGAHSIRWAWEARSSRSADEVEKNAWPLFLSRLQTAREELQQAARLDPGDPLPWRFQITVSLGLDEPIPERQRFFAEAVQRCPTLFRAHEAILNCVTEKWGGSHGAMFDFARMAAMGAKPGTALAVLPLIAHVERWLYFGFDDDYDSQKAYFSHQQVKTEVSKAASHCQNVEPPHLAVVVANFFAFCFWQMGDRKAAHPWFERAGGVHYWAPWHYLAENAYAQARNECV